MVKNTLFRTTTKIGICAIIFSGCINLNEDPDNDRISGQWRWIQSIGGIIGHTISPESEGYDQFLHFSKNYDFTMMQADSILHRGKYELEKNDNDLKLKYITSSEKFISAQIVEFNSADTLILIDECFDCYTNTYVRIN